MLDMIKMFAPLMKIDEDTRMVYGYATTSTTDSQNEIVELEASFQAVDDWRKWATIKEMHRPETAAGIAPVIEKHAGKGVYIGAEIVDDQAWRKCQKKVYKGFSIGGRVLERSKDNPNRITKYELIEISLVDRPANPDSMFVVMKRDAQIPSETEGVRGGDTMAEEITPVVETLSKTDEVSKSETAAVIASEPVIQEIAKEAKAEETILKSEYDKMAARLADLEKAMQQQNKEKEAFETLLKMLESKAPTVKKAFEEVEPPSAEEIAKSNEAKRKETVKKMSIGELTGLMLKQTPQD